MEKKIPLTSSDLEEFQKLNPEVFDLLNNPEELENIDKDSSDSIKFPEAWEKIAKKIMNSLWKFKEAEIFLKPVDPIDLGIPDYFDIIKNPMDFSTIKKKLNQSLYTKCRDFIDDIELTFNNCIKYNGEKTFIGNMSTNSRNEFKRLSQQYKLEIYL